MARLPGIEDSLGHVRPSARSVSARLPTVLVLDTSRSIRTSGREDELNDALQSWVEELANHDELKDCVDLAVVTFGGEVETLRLSEGGSRGFARVGDVEIPRLEADGATPMGAAIERAIELAGRRVAELKGAGQQVNRPNLFVVTDGRPTDPQGYETDAWRAALPRLREGERGNKLLVFAVGLRGADAGVLAEIAPESHFVSPRLSIAAALTIVSISSGDTLGKSGAPASEAYARVRELLQVRLGGDLG